MTHKWMPTTQDGTFAEWILPAEAWSGAQYGDDTIVIHHDARTNEWVGYTEFDQNVKRDLDYAEIANIREELDITL